MINSKKEEIKKDWRVQKTYWDTFGNLATKEIEDYWLSVIDQLIQEKVEKIEKKFNEEHETGIITCKEDIIAILKE